MVRLEPLDSKKHAQQLFESNSEEGAFFFILNLTKVPLYWELDILSKSSLIISLLLLPAIPIGVILGRKISDLMTDQQFYLLLHFLLGVVGLQLLVSVHA